MFMRRGWGTCGVAAISALLGLAIASVHAQAAAKMSFEVVSIRQSKPGTPPGERLENNRFTANLTLFGYIETAWNLMPSREQMDRMLAGVPKWVSTDKFEINAVAERNPTEEQMRLMVRSLLADRT